MSTIAVDSSGQLRVSGTGKIESIFSVEIADALFRLPPIGELSVDSILKRLTPKSRASLDRLINLDDQVRKAADILKASSFGFVLNPNTPTLRIKLEDILEEVIVDCAPLMTLIFTVHGERFVSPLINDYKAIFTFDEFQAKYGRSVEEHVEITGQQKIKNMQRVIELVNAAPVTYEVCLTSKDAILPTQNVVAYSKEQIYIYARRLRMDVMSVDPVTV